MALQRVAPRAQSASRSGIELVCLIHPTVGTSGLYRKVLSGSKEIIVRRLSSSGLAIVKSPHRFYVIKHHKVRKANVDRVDGTIETRAEVTRKGIKIS